MTKIRFKKKDQKDTIYFNNFITIENIPPETYEYIVNGRAAVEWILERYQVKTDKDSGIKNDPNLWCFEQGNPRYILDLLLSVIAVSVKTVVDFALKPCNSSEKGLRIAVVGSRSITDFEIRPSRN